MVLFNSVISLPVNKVRKTNLKTNVTDSNNILQSVSSFFFIIIIVVVCFEIKPEKRRSFSKEL